MDSDFSSDVSRCGDDPLRLYGAGKSDCKVNLGGGWLKPRSNSHLTKTQRRVKIASVAPNWSNGRACLRLSSSPMLRLRGSICAFLLCLAVTGCKTDKPTRL